MKKIDAFGKVSSGSHEEGGMNSGRDLEGEGGTRFGEAEKEKADLLKRSAGDDIHDET